MKTIVFLCETVAFGVGRQFTDMICDLAITGTANLIVIVGPRRSDHHFIERLRVSGVNLYFLDMEREISWRDIQSMVRFYRIIASSGGASDSLLVGVSGKGGALARIASLVCGFRTVYIPHASPIAMASGVKRQLYLGIERLLSLRCVHVVATSKVEKALVESFVDPLKITVIRNGLAHAEIETLRERRTTHRLRTTLRLGFVGRLDEQKDPMKALHILRSISSSIPVELMIYGDGPLREKLQQAADELSVAVRFMGYKPFTEVCADFDILLNTSRYEGSPYLFLEAAAANLPVITTDVGGAAELQESGVPVLIIHHDNQVQEIVTFVKGAGLNREPDAKKISATYTSKEMASGYEELFERQIGTF
ncbi:MAG: hypothetical protein CMQ07_04580 [Gammaproteobacteria bacterium]|nr:hypothetical protein [Gammaproteobacteria bacterium]